jgi:hypothetical protein
MNGIIFNKTGGGLSVLEGMPKAGAHFSSTFIANGIKTNPPVCFIDPNTTVVKAHTNDNSTAFWASLIYIISNDIVL